jgi:hypothetical protein
MSFRFTLTAVALFLIGQCPAVAADPALPADWHGVWVGRLTVYGRDGKTFTRAMELRIAPQEGTRAVTWRMTTEMNNQEQVPQL